MASAAYIGIDANDFFPYSNIQQSWILRFGISSAWLLVLGLGQVSMSQHTSFSGRCRLLIQKSRAYQRPHVPRSTSLSCLCFIAFSIIHWINTWTYCFWATSVRSSWTTVSLATTCMVATRCSTLVR